MDPVERRTVTLEELAFITKESRNMARCDGERERDRERQGERGRERERERKLEGHDSCMCGGDEGNEEKKKKKRD